MDSIDLYPVQIHEARYGGVYEHGKWVAFSGNANIDPNSEDSEWDADDVTCITWWESNRNEPWVAVGNTPNEALANLYSKNGVM